MKPEIIPYCTPFDIWTGPQLEEIVQALQTGSGIKLNLSKQQGGFLKMLGGGLRMRRDNMYKNPYQQMIDLAESEGSGLRILSPKKVVRDCFWGKQSIQRHSTTKRTFINKPLSTSDLYKWAENLD